MMASAVHRPSRAASSGISLSNSRRARVENHNVSSTNANQNLNNTTNSTMAHNNMAHTTTQQHHTRKIQTELAQMDEIRKIQTELAQMDQILTGSNNKTNLGISIKHLKEKIIHATCSLHTERELHALFTRQTAVLSKKQSSYRKLKRSLKEASSENSTLKNQLREMWDAESDINKQNVTQSTYQFQPSQRNNNQNATVTPSVAAVTENSPQEVVDPNQALTGLVSEGQENHKTLLREFMPEIFYTHSNSMDISKMDGVVTHIPMRIIPWRGTNGEFDDTKPVLEIGGTIEAVARQILETLAFSQLSVNNTQWQDQFSSPQASPSDIDNVLSNRNNDSPSPSQKTSIVMSQPLAKTPAGKPQTRSSFYTEGQFDQILQYREQILRQHECHNHIDIDNQLRSGSGPINIMELQTYDDLQRAARDNPYI